MSIKNRNLFLSTCALMLLLYISPVYGLNGKIDSDSIKIKDSDSLVYLPNLTSKERGEHPTPSDPASANNDGYTVPYGGETRPQYSAKPLVPCGDENASRVRALVPDDMPNANTNQYGQPYMCVAKSDNEAAPDEVTYTLPDGTEVIAPEPIVLTIEDLKTLGLAPSEAHQERAPHTLKNYNTNFWVTPNAQTFTTEVNGVPVDVRATPTRYKFTYGDGNDLTTVNPGYQLGEEIWDQETPTSHKYTEPGDYQFVVTTYYRGEYSVNGGPWQVMEGEGEIAADPQLVRVWRVKAGLVADDCEQNPRAWGCPGT